MSLCRTDFSVLNILNGTKHSERNYCKHKRQPSWAVGRPEEDLTHVAYSSYLWVPCSLLDRFCEPSDTRARPSRIRGYIRISKPVQVTRRRIQHQFGMELQAIVHNTSNSDINSISNVPRFAPCPTADPLQTRPVK